MTLSLDAKVPVMHSKSRDSVARVTTEVLARVVPISTPRFSRRLVPLPIAMLMMMQVVCLLVLVLAMLLPFALEALDLSTSFGFWWLV